MHKITIMSKPGCHLCEAAVKTVQKIVAWHVETIVEEVDITQDLELLEKYRDDIPVILVDGVEKFRHQVDPDRFAQIFAGESQRNLGF
ncbi:MAG TPA: glutaredoxin family protein [Phycisphaerae bacterium]|jgi:glutaredoxin|nr:glutaredoxin family protein [Phycisphaerae bacterium]